MNGDSLMNGLPNEEQERIEADTSWASLIERREAGEHCPTPTDRPLIDIDDARLLGTATAPVEDGYTAVKHSINTAGLVVRRGRVAITGRADRCIDGTVYKGPPVDIDALPVDIDGRTQSRGLDAIATHLYGLDELVGTDAISWEELVDANGSDVAANMVTPALLVSHRNPSDPFAAYVGLVGRERHEWNLTLPDIDAHTIDDIAAMSTHTVIRRPSMTKRSSRLTIRARRRASDPVGTDSALVSFGDTVVTRRMLSSIRKLAPGEPDRVVVGLAPTESMFVGHRRVGRELSRRTARVNAKARRVSQIEEIHISALHQRVASMDRGTGSTYRIDGHTVRVSRSVRGVWNLRVTTPSGKAVTRTNRTNAQYVVNAVTNIKRNN